MSTNQERPASGAGSAPSVAVCLAYFMVIVDTTVVTVALPALRADLRAGLSGQQWVVDSYLLMLAALLLCGGALADRAGARRVFQCGLAVFVLASAGCGLAPNVGTLVFARFLQGVGAAAAVPASLALLRAEFPDAAARARAFGVWGGIAGVAAAAGPVLGGVLVNTMSWRAVFLVNLPIGLAAMVLTARCVPAPPPRPRHLDLPAQAVAVLALTALTFALIEGGRYGPSPRVMLAALVFLAATGGFLAMQRGARDPVLPLGLFRNATFAGGNAVGLLINFGFYGELFVLNLYFQQVLGYSASRAGVALLPQMGVVAAGSALSGRFSARTGSPRPTMLVGLIVGGGGLFGLIVAAPDVRYPVLAIPLAAAGFGMSFTMPAATTAVLDAVSADRAGLAAGVLNAARQVGGVIGVAVLGALVAATGPAVISGFRVAVAIAGAAFWLAAAVAAGTVARDRSARRSLTGSRPADS